MLPAAANISGIPFLKLKRFAYVINWKFFEKTMFYCKRVWAYDKGLLIEIQDFVCSFIKYKKKFLTFFILNTNKYDSKES